MREKQFSVRVAGGSSEHIRLALERAKVSCSLTDDIKSQFRSHPLEHVLTRNLLGCHLHKRILTVEVRGLARSLYIRQRHAFAYSYVA